MSRPEEEYKLKPDSVLTILLIEVLFICRDDRDEDIFSPYSTAAVTRALSLLGLITNYHADIKFCVLKITKHNCTYYHLILVQRVGYNKNLIFCSIVK